MLVSGIPWIDDLSPMDAGALMNCISEVFYGKFERSDIKRENFGGFSIQKSAKFTSTSTKITLRSHSVSDSGSFATTNRAKQKGFL